MANANRSNLYESFLQLVRLGIGTSKNVKISNRIDWVRLKTLADEQGLSAVILDALNTDGVNLTDGMPLGLKLEWIGEVLQDYEQRCELYKKAISSLAGFYNKHGYRMMVIKGLACNLDWPKPEHRPCGDIDIWQFGQYKEADMALAEEKKVTIDSSHHHHTVFYWGGFMVENHYDFVNVHTHKTNKIVEHKLKELAQDDSHYVEVFGEKVYLPSPNLHALFLLRHSMAHFAATEISIKQILDWGFFVEKHGKDVDWKWLKSMMEEIGSLDLYNVMNAICVEDLGFSPNIFPSFQFLPSLKEKVLNEILDPEIPNNKPKNLYKRVAWKIKRWKANEWKHKHVYSESMWSSFWNGVWGHLLKPASI